jgi:hypothetical protein
MEGIIMKKILACFLLIFSLLIGACASEINDPAADSGTEISETPAEADFTPRNETAAVAEPAPGYEDVYVAGGGGIADSDGTAGVAEPPVRSEAREEREVWEVWEESRSAPAADVLWSFSESDDMFAPAIDMPMPTGGGSYSVSPQSQSQNVAVQAGLMTAGEWNDNKNWDFWKNLIGQNSEFSGFAESWNINPTRRYTVKVVDENNNPIRGAEVAMQGFSAVTNHEGIAYVFRALNRGSDFNSPTQFTVTANGETQFAHAAEQNIFVFNGARSPAELKLDLMFVIDTTGSMGDELHYLQAEIDNVINTVSSNNANLPIRLSVNFYRDIGDEYVVRPFTFSTDIAAQVKNLNAQNAAGGGDRPEAVDAALQNAIHEHTWLDDSVKLMFIVLDAPPHHNQTTVPAMSRLAAEAAEKGIRIIPLLASDGCTETEFLMRVLAMTTGGTYTFVTGHSGISSGRHVEPTIGDYDVEKLNELLIKIINRYLA